MMSEPTRLLDDPAIAEGLRADLVLAKSAVLQGLDVSAGAAGLKAAIAVETSVAGTAGAGAGKMLALGLVGAVTAGALVWLALRAPDSDPQLSAVDPVAAVPGAAGIAAPEDPVPSPAEPDAAEAKVAPSIAEPEPEPDGVAVAVPVLSLAEPEASPKDVAPAVRKRPRKANKQDDYLREAKLISDARAAMKTDASGALKLLEEARSEFPRGILREERKALTILSLDKLGRSAQARASAKRFLEQHGEGPYAAVVRQVLD